ncbi:hypothetical protein PG993_010589 [Apiospora rasikravindrae]|uniref:Uncharacterized protein n=1 Tax=Apiospora rasikravindrae TaxID=990691 RepID=A0ABR1SMS8_9PEZI
MAWSRQKGSRRRPALPNRPPCSTPATRPAPISRGATTSRPFRSRQSADIYRWVDFDADAIHAHPLSLGRFSNLERARTQRLVFDSVSSGFFLMQYCDELRRQQPALRDVTVLSMDLDRLSDEEIWWMNWAFFFFELYQNNQKGPLPFYMRVLAPAPAIAELNSDNYGRGFPVKTYV